MIRAGGDPAAAAGQHRPAGRRHHGAARPRVDPGLDRHPDALRPAARLPAHAARAARRSSTSRRYVDTGGAERGWWANFDKYIVTLLKAWYGDAATEENDYGFARLPQITGDHSHFATMLRTLDGGLDGFFVMGQNPAVGSQNAGLQRRALAQPEVAGRARPGRDRDGDASGATRPRCARGELRTEDIETEVFLMPAAAHVEKDGPSPTRSAWSSGTTRRSSRPATRARSCGSCTTCASASRAHYAGSTRTRDWPIATCTGTTRSTATHRASRTPRPCCRRSTATTSRPGEPRRRLHRSCKADGSTACGCWIYSGFYTDGVNQARRRDPGDLERRGGWVSPEWAWAWPANRRILYNRASADPEGKPWSERKRYVWWDEEEKKWTGYDVPDFPADKPPDYRRRRRQGHGRDRRRRPVHHDGRRHGLAVLARAGCSTARCRRTTSRSSRRSTTCSTRTSAPTRRRSAGTGRTTRAAPTGDPRYPIVATTFRLTEHHTAGGMSRSCRGWPSCSPRCSPSSTRARARRAASRTAAGW